MTREDVYMFLNFVVTFKSSINKNRYIREIKKCGNIPISIVISYYYVRKVFNEEGDPDFFKRGNKNDQELRKFLIACYRVVLDGSISRIRKYAEKILQGTYKKI